MTENAKKFIDGYMRSQTGLITTIILTASATIGLIFYIDSRLQILPTVF